MILRIKYSQYQKLNLEIKNLKEQLKNQNNEEQQIMIINLQDNLNGLNKIIKEKDLEIKKMKEMVLQKDKIINDLNILLKNPNNYNIRNQIRAVLITCINPEINYAIPCLATDNFQDVKQKLYSIFPELNNNRIKYHFLKGGRLIQNSDIIDKNKIGDGYPIQIQTQELSNSMLSIHNH